MATIQDVVAVLATLKPMDLDIVNSLVQHLKGLPENPSPQDMNDAKLYWQEMAGENQWRHRTAAPVWDELAAALKKPTENFRHIQELKLRLRALGEI